MSRREKWFSLQRDNVIGQCDEVRDLGLSKDLEPLPKFGMMGASFEWW